MISAPTSRVSGILANNLLNICLPLVIVVSSAILAAQPELRLAVPLLAGLTAVMAVTATLAFYLGNLGKAGWSPAVILGVALLLRLMFLFTPPQLSDDAYRYLWDGHTLLRGGNPYAAAPANVTPPPGLASVHSRINHPEYVTIYPPAAQLIFAAGAAAGLGVTGLKGILVLLDLVLCGLLILLLKRLGLPAGHAVLYAWNPLPVLEIAASGHVDGAGMCLIIAACYLLVSGQSGGDSTATGDHRPARYLLAGGLAAAAGLVKLFPLVLIPALLLLVPAGRRRYFTGAFAAGTALLLAPFSQKLDGLLATLDLYARNWEFAGFAFGALRGMTGSGTAARLILGSTFFGVLLAGYGLLFLQVRNRADDGRRVLSVCYSIAMAFLLLTPTLQPWYALALAPLLPFAAGPAGIVLCWAAFLSYRVQIPYFILGQWTEDPRVTATLFLAPVTAWLLGTVLNHSRRTRT